MLTNCLSWKQIALMSFHIPRISPFSRPTVPAYLVFCPLSPLFCYPPTKKRKKFGRSTYYYYLCTHKRRLLTLSKLLINNKGILLAKPSTSYILPSQNISVEINVYQNNLSLDEYIINGITFSSATLSK